ncbi:Glutathione S-transferase, C-terminal domain [Musa troglodytarum]|uniref:Glutathione S-transferase, C-terminal domain n=1 Tax=Musa troglodytarum TaxID=320322 RepID=A0A9E7HM39_9LILI|nr:Glutathione S-transferase, C-terminal domain [Musa troglodytarum]
MAAAATARRCDVGAVSRRRCCLRSSTRHRNHRHSSMAPPGCTSLTHAHLRNAPGSLGIIRQEGLQEKIKLVPIDLDNKPAWYKEKVYPANKVPSLEHNNEVKGESLDLVKYIDKYFEGPELQPDDPAKQQFAEELLSYCDIFNKVMYTATTSKGDVGDDVGAALNKLEDALLQFDDGPFFLGHFSLVDIAYAPFIERLQTFFKEVKNYDITEGRPKLTLWIEELGKIDAYTHTKQDPQVLLARLKKHYGLA